MHYCRERRPRNAKVVLKLDRNSSVSCLTFLLILEPCAKFPATVTAINVSLYGDPT